MNPCKNERERELQVLEEYKPSLVHRTKATTGGIYSLEHRGARKRGSAESLKWPLHFLLLWVQSGACRWSFWWIEWFLGHSGLIRLTWWAEPLMWLPCVAFHFEAKEKANGSSCPNWSCMGWEASSAEPWCGWPNHPFLHLQATFIYLCPPLACVPWSCMCSWFLHIWWVRSNHLHHFCFFYSLYNNYCKVHENKHAHA